MLMDYLSFEIQLRIIAMKYDFTIITGVEATHPNGSNVVEYIKTTIGYVCSSNMASGKLRVLGAFCMLDGTICFPMGSFFWPSSGIDTDAFDALDWTDEATYADFDDFYVNLLPCGLTRQRLFYRERLPFHPDVEYADGL